MTRPALPAFQSVDAALSVVYQKIQGTEVSFTVIGQGKVITPNQTTDTSSVNRIGDRNKHTIYTSTNVDMTIEVYTDRDGKTLARLFGVPPASNTFSGTEEIKPDTTVKQDLKIITFDSDATSASILFTEYVYGFTPSSNNSPLDSSSADPRTVTITGNADTYYRMYPAG